MPKLLLFTATLALALGALVLVLWFLRKRQERRDERDLVFLQILVPKKESKEDKETEAEKYTTGHDFREVLGVMDHLYQSLYGLYNSGINRLWRGQVFFSVEYAALAGEILFFVVCPRRFSPIIEKQITSFYPDVIIDEVEDYNIFTENSVVAVQTLIPAKPFAAVFKTYDQLKSDPVNAITNAFSKLQITEGAAVQFVLKPVKSGWQRTLQVEATRLINPKLHRAKWWNPISWLSAFFSMLTTGEAVELQVEEKSTGERVSTAVEEYSKSVDEKANQPGFSCIVRLVASADTPARAQTLLDTIIAAFSQFNSIRGNSLRKTRIVERRSILNRFIRRTPSRTIKQLLHARKMILGTTELAGFFHFPNIRYNKVDMIKWQNFKVAPAPKDIPQEGLYLGTNTYRGEKHRVHLKPEDRFRHFYIIGQTGTGKSSILQLMARQDFHSDRGVCVVDPHGSLIDDLLPYIPRERADDVIYFNPADTERPMGLNLLEGKTSEERDLIALDAMNMMVKMFGNEIFGPRIQDYFRNGCLTLMEDEEEGGAVKVEDLTGQGEEAPFNGVDVEILGDQRQQFKDFQGVERHGRW